MSQHTTSERIARQQACGLTKYGPEMVDEINAAYAALVAAEAEYETAANEAASLYTPTDPQERWIGWQLYLPAHLEDLYVVSNDTDNISFDRGGHGNEAYSLSIWKKNTGKFRRQTRRIRQAIEAATASTVA